VPTPKIIGNARSARAPPVPPRRCGRC